MTVGIYSLYWEDADKIYIGQSVSIEKRFHRHIWAMERKQHDNFKIQLLYNKYGLPLFNTLEVCKEELLDAKEASWIEEFNSIETGLNLCNVQESRSGIESTNSKYTKLQILLVFRALRNYKTSYESISKKYNVGGSTIRSIAMGIQHIWLQEKYPNIWKQIQDVSSKKLSYKNSLINLGKNIQYVVSPNGEKFPVENISEFARKHNLWPSTLCRLLNRKAKSTKGWSLASS